jgi:hypothetical protein
MWHIISFGLSLSNPVPCHSPIRFTRPSNTISGHDNLKKSNHSMDCSFKHSLYISTSSAIYISKNLLRISEVGIIQASRFPQKRYRYFATRRYKAFRSGLGITIRTYSAFHNPSIFLQMRSTAVDSVYICSFSINTMESSREAGRRSASIDSAIGDCNEAKRKWPLQSWRIINFTD